MPNHLFKLNGSTANYRWTFFRAGGFDQVRLQTGVDIMALDQLDQKLWMALSCPIQGLEFDKQTLALIDTDGDGRIRVQEILEAVQWAGNRLKTPDDLTKNLPELPLSSIKDDSPEGRSLLSSAREILTILGKPDSPVITTDDTANTEAIFTQTKFNGDGIVPVGSSDEADLQAVIQNIIDCLGGETDRNGNPGVSLEKVEQFFTEIRAYDAWWRESAEDNRILPLGDDTATAVVAFRLVKEKIDDYFARCRLAAFDERSIAILNRQETDYSSLADIVLSLDVTAAGGFPLARIRPNAPLPLTSDLNPAWSSSMADFLKTVVTPLNGPITSLSQTEWSNISEQFLAYDAWETRKAGATVEQLGLARIRELAEGNFQERIESLIAKDLELKEAFDHIAPVDRLIRYHRDLFTLLLNFVSFSDFYTRKKKAIFQNGTLYLDGRSCELCVRVTDVDKHAAMATLSRIYLVYCDCTRRGGEEKMTIAAAFTGGDSDFLMVGRNGVFYDCQGQDWDATIIKIIDHPISIRQAFWSPYKKVGKMVREQIMKRASARDKQLADKADSSISTTVHTVETGKPAAQPFVAPAAAPKPPFDVAKFAGIFAAIGLAFGAIGTALASVVTGFMNLQWWQMPLAVAAVLLIISGPSMIMAWLKLRQRSLGPILDANGWAVNARARINVAFGATLTKVAVLPEGSIRSLEDPFADKKSLWPKMTVLVILLLLLLYILNATGRLYDWSYGFIGKKPVISQPLVKPAGNTPQAPPSTK